MVDLRASSMFVFGTSKLAALVEERVNLTLFADAWVITATDLSDIFERLDTWVPHSAGHLRDIPLC